MGRVQVIAHCLQTKDQYFVFTVIPVHPRSFVKTAGIEPVMQRSLRYLKVGYSIHLEGPTGIGKTTLANHLAQCRRRPVVLVLGSHELTNPSQPNSWLKPACLEGWTLVYDEFNRSRPEVNTALLSALEERILTFNDGYTPECIPVHSEFRVIFTSNPEDYCGTYSPQLALLDRLITLRLPEPHMLSQQQLLSELVGISNEAAALIVGVVQQFFRQVAPENRLSLRPKLMIANICQREAICVSVDDSEFRQVCRDVLLSRSDQSVTDANAVLWELFNRCSRSVPATVPTRSLEKVRH